MKLKLTYFPLEFATFSDGDCCATVRSYTRFKTLYISDGISADSQDLRMDLGMLETHFDIEYY